jgi:hypothetical protein
MNELYIIQMLVPGKAAGGGAGVGVGIEAFDGFNVNFMGVGSCY